MITQQTQADEPRSYEQVITELTEVLNSRRRKTNRAEKFLNLVLELENNFGFKVSKYFLRNLYDTKNKSRTRNRLNHILKNVNALVLEQTRHFKEWIFKKYKTDLFNFSSGNYSVKKLSVGQAFIRNSQKHFNFIVVNPQEKQDLINNKIDMDARARQLYEFTRVLDAFNFVFN